MYIHNNPLEAKMVCKPEDCLYSSASNYAEGRGIYNVNLLWTSFEEDESDPNKTLPHPIFPKTTTPILLRSSTKTVLNGSSSAKRYCKSRESKPFLVNKKRSESSDK